MPKKPKPEPKHPREMTTDEAMEHLFHPEIVKHAKRVAGEAKAQVKSTKRKSN